MALRLARQRYCLIDFAVNLISNFSLCIFVELAQCQQRTLVRLTGHLTDPDRTFVQKLNYTTKTDICQDCVV